MGALLPRRARPVWIGGRRGGPLDAEARHRRLAEVAAERLTWVRCAVECVHHRHNASAILRTCDATGVHTVHVVGDRHFQASQGPARGADRWLDLHRHATTAEALAALRADGVALYVADLSDDAVAPVDLPLDRPLCLWFGAEALGVSDEARAAADGVVTVPMRGFAQSLNVSVAAAISLHVVTEAVRRVHGDAAHLTEAQQRDLLEAWVARDAAELDAEGVRARVEGLLDPSDG